MTTPMVSYAQNFEDVMLWRALGHVSNGFYIDVGAQDPVVDSVSKAFYESGWRGIHVEATAIYAARVRADRLDEVVLEVALSDNSGVMTFYEIPDTGLSTGDHDIAEIHRAQGCTVREITVPCITLAEVFAKAGDKDVHWLKIDVEGMEPKVLAGWGDSLVRPWVVVVESTYPNSQVETHQDWEYMLLNRDYTHVYFDGLSRFYVQADRADLAQLFSTPPNIFDKFSIATTSPYSSPSREVIAHSEQRHLAEIDQQRAQAAQNLQLTQAAHAVRETEISRQTDSLEAATQASLQQAEQSRVELVKALKAFGQLQQIRHQQTEAHAERERALAAQLLLKEQLATQTAHAHAKAIEELHLQSQAAQKVAHLDKEKIVVEQAKRAQEYAQEMQAQKSEHRQLQEKFIFSEREANQNISTLRFELQTLRHAMQLDAERAASTLAATQSEISHHFENHAAERAQLQTELALEQEISLQLGRILVQTQHALHGVQTSRMWRVTQPLRNFFASDASPIDANLESLARGTIALARSNSREAMPAESQSRLQIAVESSLSPSFYVAPSMNVPAVASSLDELLAYNDQHFVHSAYLTVLGRSSDPEGFGYYFGRLQMGFSKISILSQMYASAEAKSQPVSVTGLDSAVQRYIKSRRPLAKWWSKLLGVVDGDHPTMRSLRVVENQIANLRDDSSRRHAQITDALAATHQLTAKQANLLSEHLGKIPSDTMQVSTSISEKIIEPAGLKQLSIRANCIYLQLKAAAAIHAQKV